MFFIQSGKKEMNKAIKFTCCKKLDERNDGEKSLLRSLSEKGEVQSAKCGAQRTKR